MNARFSISDALEFACARLQSAGVENPMLDAQKMLGFTLQLQRYQLATERNRVLNETEQIRFLDAVAKREKRQPLSHILGFREFWKHEFIVTPDVLDPRADSETLIEIALQGQTPNRILDLGTGSGCLLLSLLNEWPDAEGLGTDISKQALDVAHKNATRLQLQNRVSFIQSDWWESVAGRFDLIISNPPYITEAELLELEPELSWEPQIALSPGGDGLEAYRRLASRAAEFLQPNGRILFEIGYLQKTSVDMLLSKAMLGSVKCFKDIDGRDRVIEVQT